MGTPNLSRPSVESKMRSRSSVRNRVRWVIRAVVFEDERLNPHHFHGSFLGPWVLWLNGLFNFRVVFEGLDFSIPRGKSALGC